MRVCVCSTYITIINDEQVKFFKMVKRLAESPWNQTLEFLHSLKRKQLVHIQVKYNKKT